MKFEDLKREDVVVFDTIINQGKTKIIHSLECGGAKIEDVVAMEFKDDITAGDGEKHDLVKGKALVDWKINKDIYEYLNRKGVDTHYIDSTSERISIVKKLDTKINLEVVTRRIATGSILKHTDYSEGFKFMPLKTQLFYKDDFLHDPLLDSEFLDHLYKNKQFLLIRELISKNCLIFILLEQAFAKFKIQLVDMKLEYGIIDGKLVLIDEITGGSFRLWPYADDVKSIDFREENFMSQLNPDGRLDKDLYRKGGTSLEEIRNKFQEIASITYQFKNLE